LHRVHTLERGDGPIFAKPAGRAKLFTGRVLGEDGLYYLGTASRHEPVWC
jgi:hypothetical protein